MAVTLDITINQDSYDASTNSSIVRVNVIANFTTGSYNATGNANGTLYINDVPFTFKASFNADQAVYGSELIYTEIVSIDHSVTTVVNCSATFNTGISSGTISASNSLTLSEGSSGGEDDDEPTETYWYQFNYEVGKGAVIYITGSRTSLGSPYTGSGVKNFTSAGALRYIFAEVLNPDNYDLILTVTDINGVNQIVKTDKYGTYVAVRGAGTYTEGTYNITAIARPKAMVHIDNGEELVPYLCCIDNGTEYGYYTPYIDNGESWDMYC